MLSESARMQSAAEARFRVQAPNSTPRAIAVIALDAVSEAVVRRIAAVPWNNTTFLATIEHGEAADSVEPPLDSPAAGLRDLSGHRSSISDGVDAADLVVLVAGPGGQAHAAAFIGQACRTRRVTATG